MALHEPLLQYWDGANKIKEWGEKHEHRLVARWPCPGDTALEPLCCMRIYLVKISTYLQSRLLVYKQKGWHWISPCGMVVRGQSCGVDVSGSHWVCWVAMYTVKSGCSRPNAYRYLTMTHPHALNVNMSTSFISPLFALHCFCFPCMPTFALKSRLLPPLNIDCSWIMQLISHLVTPIALYGHSPSGLHHPQNTWQST